MAATRGLHLGAKRKLARRVRLYLSLYLIDGHKRDPDVARGWLVRAHQEMGRLIALEASEVSDQVAYENDCYACGTGQGPHREGCPTGRK